LETWYTVPLKAFFFSTLTFTGALAVALVAGLAAGFELLVFGFCFVTFVTVGFAVDFASVFAAALGFAAVFARGLALALVRVFGFCLVTLVTVGFAALLVVAIFTPSFIVISLR
jgi:hypothetical protein